MKNKIFVLLLLFCSISLLTACGSKKKTVDDYLDDDSYTNYEFHTFDYDFNHTEELVAKYDGSGNLVFLAYWRVYPENTSCAGVEYTKERYVDLTYPDVKAECTVTDKGGKLYYAFTENSLKEGYLKDDEDWGLGLKNLYDSFKTEEGATAYLEDGIEYLKREGLESNDENYIIIKNKRINW